MRRITCVKGEKWNCILFNKGGTAGLASSLTVTIFFYFGGGVCMKYTALKGTKDVLPGESHLWQSLEYNIRFLTSLYGFREIRTPVIEHTELFLRGVGDTTDIVQKETYTFDDRGGRSITLKPEGTGGAVRAFVEAGLFNEPQPTKMYYLNCPVFRYEKPQAGRRREHHQFGVEVFGSASPYTDAEVISLALALFQTLGLEGLVVHINSIGCPNCRPEYQKKLKEYFVNEKIPAAKRDAIWLLATGSEILWVAGGRIGAGWKVGENTEKILEVRLSGGNDCEDQEN